MATSTSSRPTELSFSISARTAVLIGRESISSSVVAVLELLKNAYDADARSVTVRFRRASTPSGTIEIYDDGHGMSWNDIETKWMVIGTDNKTIQPISPKGRVKVGEKGIGRFALDRLASRVTIETTPQHQPQEPTYRLTIDWDKFVNTSKLLQEIRHPLETRNRRRKPGTRLLLTGLRDAWTAHDYERLYSNLAVLVPPFGAKLRGFSITFDCDESPSLSGRIRSPMARAALFKMRAKLDEKNQVRISIRTRDGSPDGAFRPFSRFQRSWEELFDIPEGASRAPDCGPLEFELNFYLREAAALKGTAVTLSQLRNFLDIYGGVHIYRDGFRVRPYGGPGGTGDWLGLSARRVRHPAGVKSRKAGKWVVGENQVAASVFISRRTNPELRDQTNREGLFVNQAFRDMRRFALKCIEYFETDRKRYELEKLPEAEPTVDDALESLKQETSDRFDQIAGVLGPRPDDSQYTAGLDALEGLKRSQINGLGAVQSLYGQEQQETMSERQLMQNMATVGIAVTAFGHEALEVSRKMMGVVKRLSTRLRSLKLPADEKVEDYTQRLHRYAQILYSVSSFALGHIDRDKRRRQKVNIDSVIQQLYDDTLREMAATHGATIELSLGAVPDIYAFPYEVESIIINFFTNSLAAFVRGQTLLARRRIEIETRHAEGSGQLQIVVRDGGPGIPNGDAERIFGLYSTKVDSEGRPIGSGLGLKIVKEIVESHGGTVQVAARGHALPGAEFTVSLPVPRKRGRRKDSFNE